MSLSRRQLLTSAALLLAAPRGAYAAALQRPGGPEAPPSAAHPLLMHWNENPYGPSPAALEAMAGTRSSIQRYVSPRDEDALVELLAEREGVRPQQIVTGTGSGEVLRALGAWAARQGGEIITADPTYDELVEYARLNGASVVAVPLDAALRHDLPAMLAAVTERTRLVYVCNPHNPSGTAFTGDTLANFIRALPRHVTAVIDEAYLELAADPAITSMISLVREGRNVVVLRTFSKIHGMAGLRFGYAVAPSALAEAFGAYRMTWANLFVPSAVRASLADTAHLEQTRALLLEDRQRIAARLAARGMRHAQAHGNFVFFDTGRPLAEFAAHMRHHHIVVGRAFPPYLTWCRITVGTRREVDWFLAALDRW